MAATYNLRRRDSIRVGKDEARAMKESQVAALPPEPADRPGEAAIELEIKATEMKRES